MKLIPRPTRPMTRIAKFGAKGLEEGEAADTEECDEGDAPGPVAGEPEVKRDCEEEVAENHRSAEPTLLDG